MAWGRRDPMGHRMKKLIVAAGLALAGLSTPAMSSSEKPNLLETATYLITNARASDFEKITPNTLIRKTILGYEYVSVLLEKDGQCVVGTGLSDEKLSPQTTPSTIKSRKLYFFHKLNGQYKTGTDIFGGAPRYVEDLEGANSFCTVEDGKSMQDLQCEDSITFSAFTQLQKINQDSRERAWKYLFENFCDPSDQPF